MRRVLGCLVMSTTVFIVLPHQAEALFREMCVNYSFGWRPVPKWENGFLIAYQTVREPSAVFLFNRSGQLVFHIKIETRTMEKYASSMLRSRPMDGWL
jgi:hypothetical protein